MPYSKYPYRVCKKCGETFQCTTNSSYCEKCRTIKKKCVVCGKEFFTRPSLRINVRTCSYICGARMRWKNVLEQRASRREPCANCGKPITRKYIGYGANKKKHLFCNNKCYGEWRKGKFTRENAPHWKGGYKEYHGANWDSQCAKTRHRDKYKCQRCGISEKKLGKKLDVHHKIPFRHFGLENYIEANKLENLISLCNVCHAYMEHH